MMATEAEITFQHDDFVGRIGLRGEYFVLGGLGNLGRPPELDAWLDQTEDTLYGDPAAIRAALESPAIQGYRDLHTAVGASSKKHVSSPESLLGTLQRKGTLPRINSIVDIYNSWSIQTLVAIGAHNLDQIEQFVHLRRLTGTERFVPLGMSEPVSVQTGEYGYVDANAEVICRMETRQVEKTKVGQNTTACFFIVQGHRGISSEEISACCAGLADSLRRFCGAGEYRHLGRL